MEILQTPENALSHSSVTAIINAPIEKVNIADWLLNLPDAEYFLAVHKNLPKILCVFLENT